MAAFAKATFGKNHDYAFVLHTDEAHPHVHLIVKNLGYDRKRLHIKKGDPHKWRESFANELRQRGIAAEATKRVVRGIATKAERQPIRQMRERGVQPDIITQQVKEVLEGTPKDKPWETKIAERHTDTRTAWLQVGKHLSMSDDSEDKRLSLEVALFVKHMPEPFTKAQQLQKKIEWHAQAKSPSLTEADKTPSRHNNRDDGTERSR